MVIQFRTFQKDRHTYTKSSVFGNVDFNKPKEMLVTLGNSWYIFNANEKPYYGRLNFTHCALSFGMMIMMSGITKVFNKSAKRNFHQRESHDDDKIATIYYDILEQGEGEILV